jgi:hypothetical protein
LRHEKIPARRPGSSTMFLVSGTRYFDVDGGSTANTLKTCLGRHS